MAATCIDEVKIPLKSGVYNPTSVPIEDLPQENLNNGKKSRDSFLLYLSAFAGRKILSGIRNN